MSAVVRRIMGGAAANQNDAEADELQVDVPEDSVNVDLPGDDRIDAIDMEDLPSITEMFEVLAVYGFSREQVASSLGDAMPTKANLQRLIQQVQRDARIATDGNAQGFITPKPPVPYGTFGRTTPSAKSTLSLLKMAELAPKQLPLTEFGAKLAKDP